VKFWLGVSFCLLTIAPPNETTVVYETFVREVESSQEWEDTPVADSLVDWDEFEKQNECLWVFIQDNDIEITLHNIMTVGNYSDIMGGACYLMGEDDE